jgi:ABC-type Fe3+ transport system substrate-binding protein
VTFAETGAPVDYVRMGRMLSTGQYVALSQRAPRPNAGKAFIDFFLGTESMKLLAKAGEFVTLKGIPQLLPDAERIQAVEMDDLDNRGFAAKRDEYKRLFLK